MFSLGFTGNNHRVYDHQPKSLHPATNNYNRSNPIFSFHPIVLTLLFIVGIIVFVAVIFLLTGGVAVESGNYYYHLSA
ncbi:MAG: hypothetical protein IJJ47_10620 [Methanosphaera sp.]|nr:hypothetical protein [Methanosphaera sp.]